MTAPTNSIEYGVFDGTDNEAIASGFDSEERANEWIIGSDFYDNGEEGGLEIDETCEHHPDRRQGYCDECDPELPEEEQ